jgi:hypothetical protein
MFTQITNDPAFLAPVGVREWLDFNKDGLLDVFVVGYDVNGGTHAHSALFLNNGDGTFRAVTNGIIVEDVGSWGSATWIDYDNDGYNDLFLLAVSGRRVPQPNSLYHNNGDGTFTKVLTGDIVTELGGNWQTCDWGDYDNDGYPDLFIVNANGQGNFLYHNNGDGSFTRITNSIVADDRGRAIPGCDCGSMGCAWGDYDNDGFLDLFVGNEGGPVGGPPPVVNFLYHNNGDGTFTKVTTGSPVNEYSDSLGVAWVDYDNDGFLDLFAARGDARGNFLYHNNGNSNSWLAVNLIGTVSNRSAIGAKVRVKAFYRGASRWQLRQISGSGMQPRANFGLGDATNVDTLRVEWPSGLVQEWHDLPVKQMLTLTEPPRLLVEESGPVPSFYLKGGRNLRYQIELSYDLQKWSLLGDSITVTNANGLAQFTPCELCGFDTLPIQGRTFYRARWIQAP